MANMKLKKGDKVVVIAGKDKGKEGKILLVDRKKNRVIVEGVNMISKHTNPVPLTSRVVSSRKKTTSTLQTLCI